MSPHQSEVPTRDGREKPCHQMATLGLMQNGTGSREETDVHESLKHSTARAGSDEGEWHNPPGDPYTVKAGEIPPTVGLPLAESEERLVHVGQGFQHNK